MSMEVELSPVERQEIYEKVENSSDAKFAHGEKSRIIFSDSYSYILKCHKARYRKYYDSDFYLLNTVDSEKPVIYIVDLEYAKYIMPDRFGKNILISFL
jgi:hypothetical protein